MTDCAPLTAEQVAALPEGAPITVTWSGGNGPHDYIITVDHRGYRYAWAEGAGERLRWHNALDFVGTEPFHTRVWPRTVPVGVVEGGTQ